MCPWRQQVAVSSTDPAPVLCGMEKTGAGKGWGKGLGAVVIFSRVAGARKALLESGLKGAGG